MKPILFFCILIASLTTGMQASAQSSEETARSLYSEGRKRYDAKQYAEAAQYLEQSLQLDKAMSTQYWLAQCYKHMGRVASAWSLLMDAANAAHAEGKQDRKELAIEEAEALKPRLPKLTIIAQEEVTQINGLNVTRNGTAVPIGQLGLEIPVDPGEQQVKATAPGHTSWEGNQTAKEGQSTTITIGALLPIDETDAEPSILPTAGLITAGVGVAALGGGLAMFFVGKNGADAADCDETNVCETEADKDERNSNRTLAYAGFGTAIAGAALAAGGTLMWLLAPGDEADEAETEPTVGVQLGFGQVGLHGTW